MAWKPGQSGNPLGRTKSAAALATLARKHCKKALKVCFAMLDSEDADMRLKAACVVLDRGLGKPPQGMTASQLTDEELMGELLARKATRDALERRNRAEAFEPEDGERQ